MVKISDRIDNLLKGISEGNESAFREYFDIKFPHMVFYAGRFIDRDRAEDIVQDIFVWIWINREKIEFGNSFDSFLRQSIYNKVINYLKRDKMIITKHSEIECTENAFQQYNR